MKTLSLTAALTGLALLVSSLHAQALPLLSESAALNSGEALTLYPDHEDPKKFYFMPNSSMIGKDSRGAPTFSFTYWGLSDPSSTDAGAFMVYIGRLASDTRQAQAIENFLQSRPGSGIAVLPIQESTITLTTTRTGEAPLAPLFSEFNFSQKGGRAEDEIGVNAVLTKTGAKVFKASIKNEAGAAFKYDMCYKVQGLGPSMDGRITVKMDRVYEHFKASASGGYLWWRASVSHEVEKLHQKNAVSWQINGGDAKDEDYLRETVAQIVQRLFTPEIKLSQAGTSSVWDKATPFSFSGGSVRREELKEETWTMKRRKLETREFCVPLPVKDLHGWQKNVLIDADAN